MNFDADTGEIACNRENGESEKTVCGIGGMVEGELVVIEECDDIDIALERRRLLTAVAAILMGCDDVDMEPSNARNLEVEAFVGKIEKISDSLVTKKQIERMMSMPPEMDEILELMEDMEYEYWWFFVRIIKNVLKTVGFSEAERNFFERLLTECEKRDEILTEICWYGSVADQCDPSIGVEHVSNNRQEFFYAFPESHLSEDDAAKILLRHCRKVLVDFTRDRTDTPLYADRLEYELLIVAEKKLSWKFLAAMDFMDKLEFPVFLSGMANNSLITFLLGMTFYDPIEFNLPFERYINPKRGNDMPCFIFIVPADKVHEKIGRRYYRKYGLRPAVARVADIRIIATSAMSIIKQELDSDEISMPSALRHKIDIEMIKRINKIFPGCGYSSTSSDIETFLRKYQFKCFNDVIFLVAYGRLNDSGVANKLKKSSISVLNDSLKETQGVMVFQEQFLLALQQFGGFTLVDAEICRRRFGRGDNKDDYKSAFMDYYIKINKATASEAERMWDDITMNVMYLICESVPAVEALLLCNVAKALK